MQDPTKTIAEAYTRQALFEQYAMNNVSNLVEAIEKYEEKNDVELSEQQIKYIVEKFLIELHG
jgi:hypothetical protein